MLLAELEIRHSRPLAPTRRVALGDLWLPTDPLPGFGGLLLAAIVGASVAKLDEESKEDLDRLIDELQHQTTLPQPRLRHRFQTDVVGLDRSVHALTGHSGDGNLRDGVGQQLTLELDTHALVFPQVLGALYAAARLSAAARPEVFRLLRRSTRWAYGDTPGLLGFLTGDEAAYKPWRPDGIAFDESWALGLLGFESHDEPSRGQIRRRFRDLLFLAHPDHGGFAEDAARRITDLSEAKRILLVGVADEAS